MICVTIVQESRRLALADMLNAATLGADMIEVRLDKFEKDANLTELVAARRKPVLFSCRRPQDGGQWTGADDERLTLLRAAVVAKADYVEIELDTANQVRPFPGCKRVVSYTNLTETPRDIEGIYDQILTKSPDVAKLTCKADTPEEAWPLIQLLNKPPVPTVVVGVGRAAVMLSLLGRKIGAPWATAALERGMEAFPGQPTVNDLVEVYRYRDVGKKTRLVGVTGTGERAFLAAGLLNAAFAHLDLPHRALPVQLGNRRLFRKVAEAVRLQDVLLDEEAYEGLHEIARLDETAHAPVLAADALVPSDDGWLASNMFGPAAVAAVEGVLRERDGEAEPLKDRVALLAGCGPLTRMVAIPLRARGTSLIWASKSRQAVQATSHAFGGRQVQWEGMYATSHDVLIVGHDGESEGTIHPGYLKPGMAVMDLTAGVHPTPILQEATDRKCAVVLPGRVLIEQVRGHVRKLGGDVPAKVLEEKLMAWMPE